MEELTKLLFDGKYVEAYEGFWQLYNKTRSNEALYYIVAIAIKYNMISDFNKLYSLVKILLNCKNDEIKSAIFETFSFYCNDKSKYEIAYKVTSQALKENFESPTIDVLYAEALFFKNNEVKNDEVENKILQSIKENSNDERIKFVSYRFIIYYYAKFNEIEKANKIFDKLIIIGDSQLASLVQLWYEINNDLSSVRKETINEAINDNNEYCCDALNDLAEAYYYEEDYQNAYIYFSKLFEKSKVFPLLRKMAICYLFLDRKSDAIALLNSYEDEFFNECNSFIGDIYVNDGFKDELRLAVDCYLKVYDNTKNINTLFDICFSYAKLCDKENLYKYIQIYEKEAPNNGHLVNYLKCKYYHIINDFNNAFKYCNKCMSKIRLYDKFLIEDLAFTQYCSSKVPTMYNSIYAKIAKNKKSLYYSIRAYFYGEYGLKENKKIVDELLKDKKIEKRNYMDSIIGAIYLENDPKLAYSYFENGLNRYNNKIDSDTSSISFVCYCKMLGIGTNKDVEYAYNLALKVIEENNNDVCENLINVYAYCSILLNKDLNNVYDFITSHFERRYPVSRLFMIIKIGEMLNKDVKKYKKSFKKALKYTNNKEKKYYKTKQDVFMMNNF